MDTLHLPDEGNRTSALKLPGAVQNGAVGPNKMHDIKVAGRHKGSSHGS